MINKLRQVLFHAITDDEKLTEMVREVLAKVKAKKEGLVYIPPLNIAVDQDGHLYWVEKTNTYRLKSISEAPLEERVKSLWGRKPTIEEETDE